MDRCAVTVELADLDAGHTTPTHTETTWVYTDNPDDPCGYCVGWSTRGNPIDTKGRIVPRLFSGVHDGCAESVAQYSAENAGQP